jgi:hypothetical protein
MREGMGGREAYGEGWCRRGVVVWILYENTMIVAFIPRAQIGTGNKQLNPLRKGTAITKAIRPPSDPPPAS